MDLPTIVKCILQGPEDESSWKKLEALRRAVCTIAEGQCEVFFRDAAEVEAVAVAIEACDSNDFADEVGKGSKIPRGSRVKTDIGRRKKDVSRRRELVAASVRALMENDSVCVKMRPGGTCRAPPLDDFGQLMFGDEEEEAREEEEDEVEDEDGRRSKRKRKWQRKRTVEKIRQIAEDMSLSEEETLDRMLLVLGV